MEERTEEVDVSELINGEMGEAYAHEYDRYLLFFHRLALTDEAIACFNVPPCWAPFIEYLGHDVRSTVHYPLWDCDDMDWERAYKNARDPRRVVEVASTVRPELVHALYCYDTEWRRSPAALQKTFPVTCNGSFFRPEVRLYQEKLRAYEPTKRKLVLVPCAAAKPYPAPVHRAVLARLPGGAESEWDVVVATGVLGLVPQEMWDQAPHYDSGLPNLDRVRDTVAWYFTKHAFERIVVYSDFYAHAIRDGLMKATLRTDATVDFMLGAYFRDTYENLTLMEHLDALERKLWSYQ